MHSTTTSAARRPFARSFAGLAAVVCLQLAAGARAQDLPPLKPEVKPAGKQAPLPEKPIPSGSPKSRIEIELPSRPEAAPEPVAATPEALVASLLDPLGRYPAAEAEGAIEELYLAGPTVAPPLRRVLEGIRFPPKIGAAVALGRLKDAEAVSLVEGLLVDGRAARSALALLGALAAIDPARGLETAARLAGDKNQKLSVAAFRYLRTRDAAEVVPTLRELLASPLGRVRKQAFLQLEALKSKDLAADAMRLLGDDEPLLSERAARVLAAGADPSAVAALQAELAAERPTRRSLWALLALAEREELQNEELLDPALRAELERRLAARDPLERISAAIALTQICLRADTAEAEELLAERVLPALIETFLKNEYFKDYLPLFHFAAPRVRRITGVELGNDVAEWRASWAGQGTAPLVRRDLKPEQLAELKDRLIVRWKRRGLPLLGRDRELVFASDALLDTPAASSSERPFFLDGPALDRLVTALVDGGAFARGRRAAADDGLGSGTRQLRLSADNRERTLVAAGGDDGAFAGFEATLFDLADELYWQRLYGGAPEGFGAFYRIEGPQFAMAADERDRNLRFLRGLGATLPQLAPRERIDALEALLARPSLVKALTPDELAVLQVGCSTESVPEGAASLLARVVIESGNRDLFQPFGAFALQQFKEDGRPLLGRVIAAFDLLPQALADPDPELRIAAVELAAVRPPADASQLLRAVDDAEPRVRRGAIFALAHLQDAAAEQRLFDIARGSDPTMKRVAVEALAQVGSDAALEHVAAALESGDAPLALAAVRGLAHCPRDREAVKLLVAAAARGAEAGGTGFAPLDALAALGTPAARTALLRLQDAAGDGEQPQAARDEVALRLVQLGEVAGVPQLIAALDDPGRASRALDALALHFCSDGGVRGEVFVQRFQDDPQLPAEDWLRRALGLPELAGGEPVPLAALVAALRDPRWFVRTNVVRRLERSFETSLGPPLRYATDEDADHQAARWEGYLATRGGTGP